MCVTAYVKKHRNIIYIFRFQLMLCCLKITPVDKKILYSLRTGGRGSGVVAGADGGRQEDDDTRERLQRVRKKYPGEYDIYPYTATVFLNVDTVCSVNWYRKQSINDSVFIHVFVFCLSTPTACSKSCLHRLILWLCSNSWSRWRPSGATPLWSGRLGWANCHL